MPKTKHLSLKWPCRIADEELVRLQRSLGDTKVFVPTWKRG